MRPLCAALLAGLVLAGGAQAATIRVAVASLGDQEIGWNIWQHAGELCAAPVRVDSTRWRLDCRDAPAVATALAAYGRASAHGRRVDFRAAFAWRRFPLFLDHLAVRGTRRCSAVSAGPKRIVCIRPGLRLEFVRMEPHAAAAAFARGEVDVAPVPAGDLRAALADPKLRGKVRVRPLDAVDVVRFDMPGGVLADHALVRRAYWGTADRADYSLLASDGIGRPAFGLLPGSPAQQPDAFRAAKQRLKSVPRFRVRIAGDPELASIAVADWRNLGLGAVVAAGAPDRFERLTALYPGPEGLFLALQPRPGTLLRAALAAPDPAPALGRLDARLRQQATVVPLAWAVGARLVSTRLRGWRQNALGLADYLTVRVTSPHP